MKIVYRRLQGQGGEKKVFGKVDKMVKWWQPAFSPFPAVFSVIPRLID